MQPLRDRDLAHIGLGETRIVHEALQHDRVQRALRGKAPRCVVDVRQEGVAADCVRSTVIDRGRALVVTVDQRHHLAHPGMDGQDTLLDAHHRVRLHTPVRVDAEDLRHSFMGGGRPRDQTVDLRLVDPRILQRSLESNCGVTEGVVRFLLGPHRRVVLDPVARNPHLPDEGNLPND